jgi:hypothetical protein
MIRALFIFAKLNPGLTYIQGMNELLAPLYYTFRTDIDADAAQHAEADAFYCFIDLISEFRDNFCQSLVQAHHALSLQHLCISGAFDPRDQ